MKYLKTFENYELTPEDRTKLEKMAESLGMSLSSVSNAIENKFEKLPEPEKEKVYTEFNKLAEKLKLSTNDMKDPYLVEKAIKESKTVNLIDFQRESKFFDNIKDVFKKLKNKLLKGLAILGVAGTLLGILMAGYYADEDIKRGEEQSRFGSINPSEMATLGGTISIISLSIALLAASLADWKKQGSTGPRSI
jgi:arsenate reductase-like glutaredoxin family protein